MADVVFTRGGNQYMDNGEVWDAAGNYIAQYCYYEHHGGQNKQASGDRERER